MANFTAMKVKNLAQFEQQGNKSTEAEAYAVIVGGFVTRNTPVTNWPFFSLSLVTVPVEIVQPSLQLITPPPPHPASNYRPIYLETNKETKNTFN